MKTIVITAQTPIVVPDEEVLDIDAVDIAGKTTSRP
jgi:hypothetical protein